MGDFVSSICKYLSPNCIFHTLPFHVVTEFSIKPESFVEQI